MKAHAELSASGSEIWLNCPGSVALSRKAPEKPESPYAVEGTKAHELLERLARAYTGPGAVTMPRLNKYPPGMVKAVRFAMEEFKKSWSPKKEIHVETRVDLGIVDPIFKDMFGTLDLGFAELFGTLEIADYKHGSGVKVEIFKETASGTKILNTQLVFYALGLAALYDFNFKDVVLKIIQPRCAQGMPVSEIRVPMRELLSYIELFKKGVKRTKDPKARRHAGPWCKFCKARPICPEGKQGYRTDARNDFL